MSHCLLLIDDDLDFRESTAELLRDAGFEVMLANSAPQALECASRQKPSLCLLDIAMPGVDGVQLLRYFKSRHLFRLMPVIVVTAGIRKEALQDLLKLGVKDVMMKSKFSIDELVDRVYKRLSGPTEVIRSPELAPVESSRKKEIFANSSDFPVAAPDSDFGGPGSNFEGSRPAPEPAGALNRHVLSPALIQALGNMRAFSNITDALLTAASRPGGSLTDLETIVRRDPVIAAKMVQTANSAAFMRETPVNRLEEALRVLGMANITRIATSGVMLHPEDLRSEGGEDLISIWRNSLATGMIAEAMAERPDKPAAFLQGLLHDLPTFFAVQFLGSDWLPWRSHGMVKGWPLREALSSALGCSLESLSGQILQAYRIPASVAGPIQEFHEFFLASKPREPGRAARLLEIARLLAAASGRPATLLSDVRSLYREEVKGLDLPALLRPEILDQIALLEHSCGIPIPNSEFVALNRDVVLWRDARWAEPDPVESVLAHATDCLRVDKFEDLKAWDRVRVAIAEPGTLEWERLGQVAPVIVLHRGSTRAEPLPPGVEALRMPVPIHLLFHKIRSHV